MMFNMAMPVRKDIEPVINMMLGILQDERHIDRLIEHSKMMLSPLGTCTQGQTDSGSGPAVLGVPEMAGSVMLVLIPSFFILVVQAVVYCRGTKPV